MPGDDLAVVHALHVCSARVVAVGVWSGEFLNHQMDAKILNFFSFLSARYEVYRDSWNDVAIEVYYHPDHDFNIERIGVMPLPAAKAT